MVDKLTFTGFRRPNSLFKNKITLKIQNERYFLSCVASEYYKPWAYKWDFTVFVLNAFETFQKLINGGIVINGLGCSKSQKLINVPPRLLGTEE